MYRNAQHPEQLSINSRQRREEYEPRGRSIKTRKTSVLYCKVAAKLAKPSSCTQPYTAASKHNINTPYVCSLPPADLQNDFSTTASLYPPHAGLRARQWKSATRTQEAHYWATTKAKTRMPGERVEKRQRVLPECMHALGAFLGAQEATPQRAAAVTAKGCYNYLLYKPRRRLVSSSDQCRGHTRYAVLVTRKRRPAFLLPGDSGLQKEMQRVLFHKDVSVSPQSTLSVEGT